MCPQQYFMEYVLGWRGKGGIKADKGTIVHKALEVMALAKKAKQDGLSFYTDDILGEVSSSRYDLNEITERIYTYYSTAFSYHDWKPRDLKDCINWTWKAVKFNDGMFDPRKRDIVEAEPHFDFEIDEPWAKYEYNLSGEKIRGTLSMKGTIDLITKVDDGFYEIVDWKTGRRLDWATGEEKTFAKLTKDPQLRIYHYAASQLYPEAEQIMGTIYFINDGGPFSMCFTKKDMPETKAMIKKKFEEIKSTRIPRLKRSWKCSKICHQGMTTFEDTGIHPMLETRHGKVTPYGQVMSKCEQARYEIESKGMKKVVEEYTAPNHDVAKYKAPGSIE